MTRAARACLCLQALIILAGLAGAAHAERAAADPCAGRTGVLGVSRIVEIDAAEAPRFGAQYRDGSFLEDGEVVLTFDDGPLRQYTQRVLDALDEHCAKATFFIVGIMAIADPETLRETARRGHTIGIHTWSHKKQSSLSAEKGREEIELGLSATAAALGAPVAPFFRFPYLRDTKASLAYLERRGIATFGIDIDSRDFNTRNPGVVQRNVMSQLKSRGKGILLMHDIQPSTAGAVRTLLSEIKAQGFRIVHMVPKAAALTVPQYDTAASEALARKVVAAAKSPLATRSVVWPNMAPKSKVSAKVPFPVGGQDELPWLKGTSVEGAGAVEAAPVAAPAPAPMPASRPRKRPEPEEDPWQLRSMGR